MAGLLEQFNKVVEETEKLKKDIGWDEIAEKELQKEVAEELEKETISETGGIVRKGARWNYKAQKEGYCVKCNRQTLTQADWDDKSYTCKGCK